MKKANTTFQTYADITDEQFDLWKKEFTGGIKVIEVPIMDEDDEDYDPKQVARFVLKRNPKRSVIKSIRYQATKETPNLEKIEQMSWNEVLLGGDMQYLDEEEGLHFVYSAVDQAIGKIMNGGKARLGKRSKKK